jgi:ammonia channel protein AmtB
MWGVLNVGIFGNDSNAGYAGYLGSSEGYHPFRSGEQFGVQVVAVLAIAAWTAFNAFILFSIIKITVELRVNPLVENKGIDKYEHNAEAYQIGDYAQYDLKLKKIQEEKKRHEKSSKEDVKSMDDDESEIENII